MSLVLMRSPVKSTNQMESACTAANFETAHGPQKSAIRGEDGSNDVRIKATVVSCHNMIELIYVTKDVNVGYQNRCYAPAINSNFLWNLILRTSPCTIA